MGQHRSGERGQILILGALMMTVMLGFLGLVIDVGNAYAQRRFMQNAADAASVAAARQLAFGMQTGVSDAAVLDTLNTYLAANGQAAPVTAGGPSTAWYTQIDGTPVRPVGGGAVPRADATNIRGVKVVAGKRFETFFAGVIGYPTLGVAASGGAAYGSASSLLLNWAQTGVPVLPLAFDIQAYQNGTGARPSGCSGNGFAGFGNGSPFVYSDYVDTPSDCALGTRDMHFSYSTLNVGDNCSDSTVKTQFERLIQDPESFGDTSIQVDPSGVNGTPIHICHGSRLANPELVVGVNRTIAVPLVSHAAAAACTPQCVARVVGIALVRITSWGGSGSNQYYNGYWVNPLGQRPVAGLQLGTTSVITGVPTFALTQ